MYTVKMHQFHGGATLYCGKSLAQAIKIARKHDCSANGHSLACPEIWRDDTGERLANWHAAKPFHTANEPFWY